MLEMLKEMWREDWLARLLVIGYLILISAIVVVVLEAFHLTEIEK